MAINGTRANHRFYVYRRVALDETKIGDEVNDDFQRVAKFYAREESSTPKPEQVADYTDISDMSISVFGLDAKDVKKDDFFIEIDELLGKRWYNIVGSQLNSKGRNRDILFHLKEDSGDKYDLLFASFGETVEDDIKDWETPPTKSDDGK